MQFRSKSQNYITLGDLDLLKGGAVSSSITSGRSPTTSITKNLGTALGNYAARKGSDKIAKFGAGLAASSYAYQGKKNRKIWVSDRKSEHRKARGRKGKHHPLHRQKVDSRKYQYRPEGFRGERIRRRFDGRYISNEALHWELRPESKSRYAKSNPYQVRKTQARMRFTGVSLYGVGKAVPFLGYTALGYGLYKGTIDPNNALDLFGIPQGNPTQAQRARAMELKPLHVSIYNAFSSILD